jgi:hypothetical protein
MGILTGGAGPLDLSLAVPHRVQAGPSGATRHHGPNDTGGHADALPLPAGPDRPRAARPLAVSAETPRTLDTSC